MQPRFPPFLHRHVAPVPHQLPALPGPHRRGPGVGSG
ncbi:unnamed protein product [Linum tenue]|uniref:Uncharacterized protein n=1 Tax=Linum tenue TaxID=586396 RepID=A0AAV0S302_9ROSI|nr:unnamed protein product [Linum tenue]